MKSGLGAILIACVLLAAVILFVSCTASAGSSEDPRLGEARTLLDEGKYAEGIAVLDKVLAEEPDHRDALFLKALAYEWQGKIDDALKIYRTIVSVHEEDLDAWLEVAKLEVRKENYNEAISLYGSLIAKFGEEPPILAGLARALTESNRLDEALKYYDRVLLQEPDNVQALAGKAEVLRLTGETQEAREVIGQAKRLEPTFPEVVAESRAIDLVLRPKVSAGYCESREKNFLRSEDTDRYNREDRTWRTGVEFFPGVLESVGLMLWTSRDKETDDVLKKDNFELTTVGFSANLVLRPSKPIQLGGGLKVVQYQNHTEQILFPILSDVDREGYFDVWVSAQHGSWGANLGVLTRPFFDKSSTPPALGLSSEKLEIASETASHFGITRSFSKTVQCSLSYEGGNYSDGNDRNRVGGSIELSTWRVSWLSALYGLYYQDFLRTSKNYFTPKDELNQRIEIRARKMTRKTALDAGLRFGLSGSDNFNTIFSGCVYGSVSRMLTDRLKLEGKGSLAYDDKEYSMGAFYLGLELGL